MPETVAVIGGAGYVGAVLVPKLLAKGHTVRVLDLFIYGDHVFNGAGNHPKLTKIKADMRDPKAVEKAVAGAGSIIHLACISNDPSFELNPSLGKTINYDCFAPLVQRANYNGVKRFIYASSSSVYGVKSEPNVSEELSLEPLTDYSKFKALCEEVLAKEASSQMTTLILRPATVCGYSPRLRLDLSVNILTAHAFFNKKIMVFGGNQMRPNIHIDDVTDLYVKSLEWPAEKINRKIYNAGYENRTVMNIAELVKKEVGDDVKIEVTSTNDNRSYHISSEKIKKELGFTAKKTISDAIKDLVAAFRSGKVKDPFNNTLYYNIKRMQEINLK